MKNFACLIVDDEPIARDILLHYCKQLPNLTVAGTAGSALEAKSILQQQPVDILFLDINMPVLDGLSFLKTLRQPPAVIFTTAYKEYAVDAFDLSATDYLLKPFSLDRFIVAVDRVTATGAQPFTEISQPGADYLFVKSDGKIYRVAFDNILYAEANGNYTRVVCVDQLLLPAVPFSTMEEQLPGENFIRVHRSFIINKNRIGHIEGNRVFIAGKEIPIGSNYKDVFLQKIGFRF